MHGNSEINLITLVWNSFRKIINSKNLIMWGYFCIAFINFYVQRKNMTGFAKLFSLHDSEKNDKILWIIFCMNEPHMCDIKQIYLQLVIALQFRYIRSKKIKDFSLQKSMTDKRRTRPLIIILQHSIMQTRPCLFSQARTVVFLFFYSLLSLVYLSLVYSQC